MMHSTLGAVQIVAAIGVVSSIFYYVLCFWSAANFIREAQIKRNGNENLAHDETRFPPISILKPLKGAEPEMFESFRSHCLQDYPDFEIIFGVSDKSDPAIQIVERLRREFPEKKISLVVCSQRLGANVKVSNLAQMVLEARHQHLIVNDSDIRVGFDYLRRIVAPLADRKVGLVTCLYRGVPAATLGSRLEALGISTDFCPSVLAARQLEDGLRFGLGSTLAFRRADLGKIGGFVAFVDYLADDYELGKRIAGLGMSVTLSEVVVETWLPAYGLQDFWAHQLRWARGVRDARSGGYLGLIFTFGIFWSVLAVAASRGASWAWVALAMVALCRSTIVAVVGRRILRDRHALPDAWLIPIRDLIAPAIWMAGLFGRTVTWRGDQYILRKGKLIRRSP